MIVLGHLLDTDVRQLFAYNQIDHPELIEIMNDIYHWIWNHFYPIIKLKSKYRIGGKLRKLFHTPATPFHRLIGA